MHKKSKIYKKGSINKIETWSQLRYNKDINNEVHE